MAKSVFNIHSEFEGGEKTIKEISSHLVEILTALGKIDKIFLSPIYVKGGIKQQFNIKGNNRSQIEKDLANLILFSYKEEITKNEENPSITINFSRDIGFLILLEFYKNNERMCAVLSKMGAVEYQDFRIYNINKKFEFPFSWYEELIKELVQKTKSKYAVVSLNLPSFTDFLRPLNIKYSLGWITYFCNEFSFFRTTNTEEFEYEYSDKGVYIFFSKEEDLTENKKVYELKKSILIKANQNLRECDDNLSRDYF